MYEHLQKVGITDFRFLILEQITSFCGQKVTNPIGPNDWGIEKVKARERHWIYEMGSIWPSGFNLDDGYSAHTKKSRVTKQAKK